MEAIIMWAGMMAFMAAGARMMIRRQRRPRHPEAADEVSRLRHLRASHLSTLGHRSARTPFGH